MKVYVKLKRESDSTGGYDPNDRWSRDSTTSTWEFEDVTSDQKEWSYWDGKVDDFEIDAKVGDIVYPVYVIYSTGDSFGHDEQACCEIMDVFKTAEEAYALKKWIEEDLTQPKKRGGIGYSKRTAPNGKDYYTYAWKGYFEHFNYCSVAVAQIK